MLKVEILPSAAYYERFLEDFGNNITFVSLIVFEDKLLFTYLEGSEST